MKSKNVKYNKKGIGGIIIPYNVKNKYCFMNPENVKNHIKNMGIILSRNPEG